MHLQRKPMKQLLITMLSVLFFSLGCKSQIGRLALSPLQKIEQNIAKTDITIEYSRPSKKDRIIFGGLVPFNQYWRTGANRNTTINFTQDVVIGGTRVKKGKYSIITKPHSTAWEFLLYSDTDNWNVPETLDSTKIVAITTVEPQRLSETIESMRITIGDFSNYDFNLVIEWEKTKIIVPVLLTTKETMASLIKDELDGPTSGDYYSAAVYQLESEKDYEQGLTWINQAIENRIDPVWYDFRVKAILLLELNRMDEIKSVIELGAQLAKIKNSDYGINEFKRIDSLVNN